MLKESENPPLVWPEQNSLDSFTGQWWVAHTKARNEKALAWDLTRKNVQYFLPMTKKVRKSRGRTFRSQLPLFSGYLFFCGEEPDRIEVLRTNRVANIIEVQDQQQLVRELSQIQQALQAGVQLEPHAYIKVGQKCKAIAGPLMGMEGIVTSQSGKTRLVLQVDMLGQATSLEIESDMLEVVET